jgi:hypothetical protein
MIKTNGESRNQNYGDRLLASAQTFLGPFAFRKQAEQPDNMQTRKTDLRNRNSLSSSRSLALPDALSASV